MPHPDAEEYAERDRIRVSKMTREESLLEVLEALVERIYDTKPWINTWQSWEFDYWIDQRAKDLIGEERFKYLTVDQWVVTCGTEN